MAQVTYIKKSTLEFTHLWNVLNLERDRGGRWNVGNNTPDFVKEYLQDFRTPSRAWPHSYSKALLSQKFAKFLVEKDAEMAVKCGVAQ